MQPTLDAAVVGVSSFRGVFKVNGHPAGNSDVHTHMYYGITVKDGCRHRIIGSVNSGWTLPRLHFSRRFLREAQRRGENLRLGPVLESFSSDDVLSTDHFEVRFADVVSTTRDLVHYMTTSPRDENAHSVGF